MTDLLKGETRKKKQSIELVTEQKFVTIKDIFRSKYVLISQNINRPFVLFTDCFTVAMAFCLKTIQEQSSSSSVLWTCKLTVSEQRMSTIQQELLALQRAFLCTRNTY